jgi:hypothetical protein
MGLSVYLARYENFEQAKALEDRFRAESKKIWDNAEITYEEMSEDEKNACRMECEVLASNMGLDADGRVLDGREEVCFDSTVYPEHMFKVGYIRSSYNEGGIDYLLQRALNVRLAEIFGYTNKSDFSPDWDSALEKLDSVYIRLKGMLRDGKFFDVMKFDTGFLMHLKIPRALPESPHQALMKFLDEFAKHKGDGAYSSADGEFYLKDPVKLHGIMPGTQKIGSAESEVIYLIFDNKIDWYLEAIEIMKEMVSFVISSGESEKYYLHWSA